MAAQKREDGEMRTLYLIAILFVVDGHIPLPDLFDLGGLMGYYSFHLLLFAFGAGVFFRLRGNPAEDALQRARRLLLPLYAWNLAYGLFAAALRRFGGFSLGAPLTWQTLLLSPLTDGEHFVWNLGAWYLFPLFLAQILYAGLRRLPGRAKDVRAAFLVSLAAGCAAVSLLSAGNREPLWLLRALVLLPGYAGGALYAERLRARDTLPSVPYFALVLLGRALLLLVFGRPNYLLSSGTYFDAGPVGVYAGGALAIAFWLRAARLFAPAASESRLAMYAARHTRSIMMHHYLGFLAVNGVFLIANRFGFGAADFSVRLLRTQSGYVYAPGEAAGWTVLYLAAGMLLPLLIARAGERALALAGRVHGAKGKGDPEDGSGD